MKLLMIMPIVLIKTKLDLLSDTNKDLLLLVTLLRTVLIIVLLTHHAIFSKHMKRLSLELEMVFVDFLITMLPDVLLLKLQV